MSLISNKGWARCFDDARTDDPTHAVQAPIARTLEIINQPLASTPSAKKSSTSTEGRRPHRSRPSFPRLHLVQMIRDEAHHFAVTFQRNPEPGHRTKRNPGVGESTTRRLEHFGSLKAVKQAEWGLSAVVRTLRLRPSRYFRNAEAVTAANRLVARLN